MRDAAAVASAGAADLARVAAGLRLRVKPGPGGRSVIEDLYQLGSARLRFPRAGTRLQAVVINTAGGLTGGDRWDCEISLGAGTALTVTTPACERIYRALAGAAEVSSRLALGAGSRLDWLPQETILYEGAALSRRLEIAMAEDAELLAIEPILLGRLAMGEEVHHLALQDRWRLRRGGRLVFADGLSIAGATAPLYGSAAALAGCRAFAMLLLAAPDAEAKLAPLRDRLAALGATAGASAWDGLLAARIAAPDGAALRRILVALLALLRDDGSPPRLWSC